MRSLILFFLLWFTVLTAFPQGNDVVARLTNDKKREVDAGVNINVVVNLTNKSNTDKVIELRLKAKGEGWKFISDYSNLSAEKNASVNRIIGVQIPNNLRAGDFIVEIEAFDKKNAQSIGVLKLPINVKPRYEINVEKMKSVSYVYAGDTVGARFWIQNKSNLDIEVKTTAIYQQETRTKTLSIPKDSSAFVSFSVKTTKDIDSYTQQSMVMSACIKDKPETEQNIYNNFDLFPSSNVQFDRFKRLPVKVTGIGVSSNRFGNRIYSSMFEVIGNGYINEIKKERIEFKLRGPDQSGNPLFGLNEEYFLRYMAPHVEVSLGDVNYSLSELTESSRNGRGGMAKINFNKFTIGGFYNHPRYYPSIKEVFSAFSNYTFNNDNVISAGLLNKLDTMDNATQLISLSGINKPFNWLRTTYEIALGQRNNIISNAYKGSVSVKFGKISSHFSYLQAQPDFPGFVTNTRRLISGVNVSLKRFGINFQYDTNDSNLALDTMYANAPFSENFSLSGNFQLSPNHTLTLGGFANTVRDKAPIPLFNYKQYNGQLCLNDQFGIVTTNLAGDYGIMDNYLGAAGHENSIFYNGSFHLGILFSEAISMTGYCNYQGGKQKNVTGKDQFYYGGAIAARIKDRFSIDFNYTSNYEFRYYTTDRSLISLQSVCQINDNNEFSLGLNYNLVRNTLNQKELNAQLRYSHTFSLPIAKRKDVGSLIGKIINNGVESVDKIRLNLNGITVLTDKNGNFRFPVVKVGNYMLGTLETSFGLNTITEEPGPFWVEIKPGVVTHFEFSVTKSARIEGHLVIQEDQHTGQKGFIPFKEEIDKLIIEASNGKETFRILSGRDGSFNFEDLRPGSWKVKIYPNGIPPSFQLMTSDFNIVLTPGKHEKIDVILQKKVRQIRFQNSFK